MSLRVLLLVHGLPPAGCGGTETYVWDLARALARQPDVEVTVLAREGDALRPELAVRRQRLGGVNVILVNNTFQACESFDDTYRNPALRKVVAPLLDAIRVDVVHVQHLTCLSTELVEEFVARGIPVIATLNDYWLMCHRGQLVDADGRRCDGPGTEGCAGCIPSAALAPRDAWRAGRAARDIPVLRTAVALAERVANATPNTGARKEASRRRSDHVREMCAHVDLFLAPSHTLLARHVAFGIPCSRIEWIDQGIDLSLFEHLAPDTGSHDVRSRDFRAQAEEPLRVGFAGSLIPSKAPHVLLEAVSRLPPGTISLHIIGATASYHGSDEYAQRLREELARAPIASLGPVPHDRVAQRLADIDVLVVPSVWIENAPFIIREAFASGVPVIASDLGGMAEMVRDGVDGLVFQAGNATALSEALRRVATERGLLGTLRRGIRPMMSIDEDAGQLVERYRRFVHPVRTARAERDASSTRTIAAVVLNYRTPEQTWLAVRSVQSSRRPPDDLIVVDNGSDDGSEAVLRERCSGALVVQTGANLGFSAGCNVGIRRALERGARAVLLVNSDVVLAPDAIGALEHVLSSTPSAGIAGAVILSRAEPDIVASAGMSFAPRTGRMRHHAAGRRLSSLEPGVRVVNAVAGCAVLIKRDVFDRVGMFDEDYFFSYEDLDFCVRAARAGFETVRVPEALSYHEGGASIGRRSSRRVYYGVRNHLRLSERLFPLPPVASASRRAAILAFTTAYVALSPEVPLLSGLASLMRGALDHVRGRYGAARG